VSVFVFVVVTSALALTAFLISQYGVFNVLPLQEAKAIKHKTPNEDKSFTKEDANIIRAGSSSSSSSSNAGSTTFPTPSCISYNLSTRTITVSCTSARLSDVFNEIHDNSILAKQSPAGTWFLSANLHIAKGATFHIDSTDTK
jgi:hypothetical protein